MRFLGGSRKTNIEWGFPEKGGGLGQFTDLGGRVFLRVGLIPQCTLRTKNVNLLR